jgi:hypothetical protein
VGARSLQKPRLVEALAAARGRATACVIGPQDARSRRRPHRETKRWSGGLISYVTPEELRRGYQTADVPCLPSTKASADLLEAAGLRRPVVQQHRLPA